jgi:adenosylmethionine-8-amino-7-oxononanoate aminotransferase
VFETIRAGGAFTHGFTFSHGPIAAAVAREVLRILEAERLVEASAAKGSHLQGLLHARLGDHPNVGEIRGRGLFAGLELVADRATRVPFPRSERVVERVLAAARERGLLLYSGTGTADGTAGDVVLIGPPFVITREELEAVVDRLAQALHITLGASVPAAA